MRKACCRKFKRYKYQLVEPYELDIGITGFTVNANKYVKLDTTGRLWISEGYAWDGPSGP